MKGARQFFDRLEDPKEARPRPDLKDLVRKYGVSLDEYRDLEARSGLRTRGALEGRTSPAPSRAECEQLKAMGYVAECR